MQCEKVRKKLEEFLDNELVADEKAEIERHLSFCRDCSAEYQAIASVNATAKETMSARPSPEYWESLPQRIAASIPRNTVKRPGWKARPVLAKYRFAYGIVGVATVSVLLFFVGRSMLYDGHTLGPRSLYWQRIPEKQRLDSVSQAPIEKKKPGEGNEEPVSAPANVESKAAGRQPVSPVKSPKHGTFSEQPKVSGSASKQPDAIRNDEASQAGSPEVTAARVVLDSGSMQPRQRRDFNTHVAEVESLPPAQVAEQQESKSLLKNRGIGEGATATYQTLAKSTKTRFLETRGQPRAGRPALPFQQNFSAMKPTDVSELSAVRPQVDRRHFLVLADTLAALRELVDMSKSKGFVKESSARVFSDLLQSRANEYARHGDKLTQPTLSDSDARKSLLPEVARLFHQAALADSLSVIKPLALRFLQSEQDGLVAAFGKEDYQRLLKELE